jgi:hypothetical protein
MRCAVVVLALLLVAGCGGGEKRHSPPGTPAAGASADAGERWPQPLRYSLDIAYESDRFMLAGSERITLRNTGPAPLDRVWLRTWGNAFGGCDRPYVSAALQGGGRAGEQRAGCTALEVVLDAPLAPGAETELVMRIQVTAPPRPDRFGRFDGAAYFGNALPVLAVADEDGWSLPPYTFHGDAFNSLVADWDVRLLRRGAQAATTGRAVSEGDDTIRSTARARDFMVVAGPLHETAARAGDVTVRHWAVGREDPGEASRAIRVARTALRGYARRLGPYRRDELDIVEGPRRVARGAGLAMEYPELVISPSTFPILAHEIAHQWWYGIVGDDEYAEPWLDESFANYSMFRLTGRFPSCPRQPYRPALTSSMDAFERAGDKAYFSIVYRGGPCSLRTVERALGRSRFDRLLRRVVHDHRDGVLTTAAFVAAVRAAAPAGVDADRLLRRAGIEPRR